MKPYTVTFLPGNLTVQVDPGSTLLQAQIAAGLRPYAPCGGKGTCGKCKVLLKGKAVPSCKTIVDSDVTIWIEKEQPVNILTSGLTVQVCPDGTDDYALAVDIGTTTVVVSLLDGHSGELLIQSSAINPQCQYGADVVSRIQHGLDGGMEDLSESIRQTLAELTLDVCKKAYVAPERITIASIVGNTAMHHLLLKIDPKPLVTPPYMPVIHEALEGGKNCKTRILPNIAGFIGGDTVGCMVSTRFDQLEKLTLLIDIGTNGEMVLGDRDRRIACSTAAGPAFEGAKISCGMRGVCGAVDHVVLDKGKIKYHVIGEGSAKGLCGSGLLDLVAVLLDAGILDESGYLEGKQYHLCENVVLTQKDIREVQLAKAAIRAGIELLAKKLGVQVGDIQTVYLAGAFGNYLNPASACRIGMIPPILVNRIVPIGNAASDGAKMCALSKTEFAYSQKLAVETEFLELASLPQFQDRFVDALGFGEQEL